MEITAIHHPIAERELQHSDGHIIRVIIGQPEPFPDGQDFYCPFHIIGLAGDKIRRAGGVDAVQALMLAKDMIGAVLYASAEFKAGQLTWNDEPELGFPTP
ncbi:MAG TPA: hypothetical protein VN229_19770 [Terriglobales bacterium]|nr:hypothetical protein [Terriglobales bacterium]